MQLLTSAMVDSSLNLPRAQMQQHLAKDIATYNKSAPATGREDRMMDALVTMKFMTPAHAASFRASIESSVQSQLSKNPQADSQAVVNAAVQTALSHEDGAQFSSCEAGEGATVVGGLAALTGLVLALYNPTCTTPYEGSSYSVDSSGSVNETDYYGPTYCTANEHPDAGAGVDLLIGGGVALGVGALAILLDENGC
jgi:hypothetical protein